ncbi:MAG TPA: monofunctional biosynthetic peptidoglycan transglycosylase [Methylotenera sp.]|nr:monofunctional biosynthetic peptidoglycan transglycosylase [Methylotenera sp.]HPH05431.1 monofunctional biosynthetic peptidoglycan transglycosylase [Methylotenera sp.]HPN01502.1 monofunctional biosynthetic peptidoglycan transglycosylase [Methylotenera sp.]
MRRWLLNKHESAQRLTVKGFLARLVVVLLAWILLYQLWIFAHICWWVSHNPTSSAFMEDRLEIIQETKPDAELKHKWVSYDQISNHLKRAVIASEDAKFIDHEGVDWEAIQAAYEKNLKKGKIVSGGSTISQQLAKNLFLSSKRTPWRKAQELVITYMLEAVLDKRRIFEIYLNVIEWGDGVFGAEAAAKHYFKVSAAKLSKQQAARLAVMIPNPRFYDKHKKTKYLTKRTTVIQKRMNASEIP